MKPKHALIALLSALAVATGISALFTPDSYAIDRIAPPPPVKPLAITGGQTTAEMLPAVGSHDNLMKLLKQARQEEERFYRTMAKMSGAAVAESAPAASPAAPASDSGKPAYSSTNVQVQGVDEADVIKTDGTYLYHATDQQVIISTAYPADSMKIVKQLRYEGERFYPRELYVDDKHLVVIGTREATSARKRPYPAISEYLPTVTALVYDIRNKESISKLRELELDGDYVSSRKIGSSLYLVSNQYADVYRIMEQKQPPILPAYYDSMASDAYKSISYHDMYYFPDRVEPAYLMVGAVNLDGKQPMKVSTYLGTGEQVYASPTHLYVTVTKWEAVTDAQPKKMFWSSPEPINKSSSIYKFELTKDDIRYAGKGEVPGTILNQFSLDEHQGYLRIATTSGDMWRDDEHTSKNNIYVLDEKMTLKGKLEDIAPGERIYSARFMGNRAYMVTFKKVDPLFVIDLKEPAEPRILGALKIPGYSDYLHPYDENHLIGFGKDTVEAKDDTRNFAWYQGMKIALFDVTDVTQPKEKFKEIIGDRGTDSELLSNHKALLFSREKNLLAFPVTEMNIPESQRNASGTSSMGTTEIAASYGEFTFQGAYIYSLDLEKGFQLRKRITHLNAEQLAKSGGDWYNSRDNVKRILYIGDTLYTYSPSMVKAFQLDTLDEINQLQFPK